MMKIKAKFAISNILMLITPIFLIGVISIFYVVIFIIKFPVEDMYLTRAQLINPYTLIRAISVWLQNNPDAIWYIVIWALISVAIMVLTTTVFTQLLSRSIRRPIEELSYASDMIRKGVLDFDVLGSDYKELDELCQSFDNMRIALKASKDLEEEMKHERNMLLANISHDLKTPITAISGYIEGIKDGVADTPEKMNSYLDTIRAKAKMLDDIVNNLSAYSKLELSRLEFNFTDGDLNEFIRDFFDDYRLDLERANMALDINLTTQKAVIKIDYDKMARVFANIVNNSIKYKDGESGALSVRTYLEQNGIYTELSDIGIGISEDETKKVFDGFYRADVSRSSSNSGSGLGLGIAKQIIEKHGGKIWIKTKDKGITTIIYLPLFRKD